MASLTSRAGAKDTPQSLRSWPSKHEGLSRIPHIPTLLNTHNKPPKVLYAYDPRASKVATMELWGPGTTSLAASTSPKPMGDPAPKTQVRWFLWSTGGCPPASKGMCTHLHAQMHVHTHTQFIKLLIYKVGVRKNRHETLTHTETCFACALLFILLQSHSLLLRTFKMENRPWLMEKALHRL